MQQADGSPAGSGQAQQIDGNVIAMQMIQATTNAAEAAQAAVKAVEALKSGSDDRNWYRLLPKPGDFNPSSREDEISKWRDWSWQFEQYLGSLDHHYVSGIVDLRKDPTHVVDETAQSAEEQRRSKAWEKVFPSIGFRHSVCCHADAIFSLEPKPLE